ncbi:MAG: hypothetical protein Q8N73_01595 [bacterium]|nr:hypothetical protein [bacterium]
MSAKTQFKTDIVERYKNGESSYQISENEGCSYNTVLRELKRRGVNTGLCFWTEEEIEKLKELYPISSNEKLLKEFPNRTKETICSIASNLGLKKRECKETCKDCGKEFTIKYRRKYNKKGFCSKCAKKQWEHNNSRNAIERQRRWLQRNPEYTKTLQYRERANQYYQRLRKESPKFRLDQNMCTLIHHSLKGKKAGRSWERLVGYRLKDLIGHLENQFDEKMTWENYGNYWHIDHIKPRSLFKYTFSEEPEFKECWSLKNLQPLEKTANLRKSNIFELESS